MYASEVVYLYIELHEWEVIGTPMVTEIRGLSLESAIFLGHPGSFWDKSQAIWDNRHQIWDTFSKSGTPKSYNTKGYRGFLSFCPN